MLSIFHVSIGHLYVFFGEVSVYVFCPFLNWVVCFLGVEIDKFFIDFWILTLYQICHLQISSPILIVLCTQFGYADVQAACMCLPHH